MNGTLVDTGRFTKLARVMSRNYGITVKLTGLRACTDGTTIFIPANSDYLTEDRALYLHGVLDHEMSHVWEEVEAKRNNRISPLKMMENFMKRGKKWALMLNVYEDVRIESAMSKRYVGVAQNLRELNLMTARRFTKTGHPSRDPWELLGAAIIFKAHGMPVDWAPNSTLEILALLDQEIAAAPHADTVEDSAMLAESTMAKVEKLLEQMKQEQLARKEPKPQPKQEPEQHQEDPNNGADDDSEDEGKASGDDQEQDDEEQGDGEEDNASDGDEEGAGEDGDADQEDSQNADDQPANEGDDDPDHGSEDGEQDQAASLDAEGGQDDEEQGDGEEDDGNQSPEGDDGESAGSGSDDAPGAEPEMTDEQLAQIKEDLERMTKGDASTTDLLSGVKEEIETEAKAEALANHRWCPDPRAVQLDRWETPVKSKDVLRAFEQARDNVRPIVSTMRSKLVTTLRARSQNRLAGDKEHGSIDSSHLYSLKMGNKSVFAQRTEEIRQDVAVSVAVDCSGSMGMYDKYLYARQMAIALAETLEILRVPFEIIGYTNVDAEGKLGLPSHPDYGSGYTRVWPFRFFQFKTFEDKYKHTQHRLGAIDAHAGNMDGEAIELIALRLAQRKEARKVMFVMSDGTHSFNAETEGRKLVEAIQRITKSKIELNALGINCPDIAKYYNKDNGADYRLLEEIKDMPKAAYEMLKQKMLRN